jgi:hypothetical protein
VLHLDRTNWRRHDQSDATVAAWFGAANSAETRRSIPSDARLTAIPANCIETGHVRSQCSWHSVSLKTPHLFTHRHLKIGSCHVPEDARRRRVEIEHFGSEVLEPSFSCAAAQLCDVMTCMCVGDLMRIVWPRRLVVAGAAAAVMCGLVAIVGGSATANAIRRPVFRSNT